MLVAEDAQPCRAEQPGLQKRTAVAESMAQVAFIALGIASIWVIHAVLFPEI